MRHPPAPRGDHTIAFALLDGTPPEGTTPSLPLSNPLSPHHPSANKNSKLRAPNHFQLEPIFCFSLFRFELMLIRYRRRSLVHNGPCSYKPVVRLELLAELISSYL